MKFRILIVWSVLSLLFFFPGVASGKDSKNLVIINSYNDGAPWANNIVTPVLNEASRFTKLNSPTVIYLSNALIHNEADYLEMERRLFERLKGTKPDFLVLVGNFAFTLRDAIVKEWGNVPILLIAQSDKYYPQEFYYTYTSRDTIESEDLRLCDDPRPLEELREKYNFTLLQTPNLYKETVDMMVHMFPDMNKLVFLADPLYLNRHLSHEIHNYLLGSYPTIEYEWLMGIDENGYKLQHYLNSTDYNTGLLISTWFFERESINGYPSLIAGEARMITGARHPVFGLRAQYMSYGILGGYFPSQDVLRESINISLKNLLTGNDMSKIPFRIITESSPLVNWTKLERFGISPDRCPEGTEFINKPMSPWELYKFYIIIGGVVLVCLIVLGIGMVLLQRRKIEMLHEREQLVKSMPIGYSQAAVVHDSMGRVQDVEYHGCNESYEKLIKENERTDRPSKLFDNDMISNIVERLFRDQKPVRFSYHFKNTDTYYEFLVCIGMGSTDSCKEVDIFSIDITNLKKQEELLRQATEKAQESDKLKMAFLANMSHEIRTPLNSIVGFSNLLTKTRDEETKKKFMAIIEHNNSMLLKLINDVLYMAKVESNTLDFNFRPTDINRLLRTIESSMRLQLKPEVMLNMTLGATECVLVTDPDRLDQVLTNLLTNSKKFTKRGSITFGYEMRGEEIYFYVRDTGIGISPENINRLFTRFTKFNDFIPGTGLGLSISKSIVKRLGGEMGVESAGENRGSTFWFTIPNNQA